MLLATKIWKAQELKKTKKQIKNKNYNWLFNKWLLLAQVWADFSVVKNVNLQISSNEWSLKIWEICQRTQVQRVRVRLIKAGLGVKSQL